MKNQDIERLRGIAIFLVLLQHLSITPVLFDALRLNSKNMPFYLGVELFFVISGFVVTKSFLSKKLNLKLFYFKRLFRILPLVIAFILFTAVLNCFPTFFTTPWNIFISDAFAVLGSYLINHQHHSLYYNGAMWSLSVEMQFYLFFPIGLILLSKLNLLRNRAAILIFSAFYIAIAILARYAIVYFETLNLPKLLSHLAHWKFDFLILGVLVYLVSSERAKPEVSSQRKRLLKGIAFGMLIISSLISYHLGSALSSPSDSKSLFTFGYFFFGICFFALIKIAALDRDLLTIHPKLDKIIEYLGSRSYSIYVLHFPAFVIIWMFVNHFIPSVFYINPIYYGIVQLLLFIIIGLPIAELAFRYIEQPGIHLGEFFIKKYGLIQDQNLKTYEVSRL